MYVRTFIKIHKYINSPIFYFTEYLSSLVRISTDNIFNAPCFYKSLLTMVLTDVETRIMDAPFVVLIRHAGQRCVRSDGDINV